MSTETPEQVHIEHMREDLREIKMTLKCIDIRLERLEGWRSYTLGAAAAVGGGASFLLMWLRESLKGGRP